MFRKLTHALLLLALLTLPLGAQASLEVSLTISGDIGEIQALLAIIQERNQAQGGEGDNPLKVNVHNELDTLAIQVEGTNLSTDLNDLGTHGDVKASDGVWSVTLSPMESTPAGIYSVVLTGFDKNGQALMTQNEAGEDHVLEVRTEIAIER